MTDEAEPRDLEENLLVRGLADLDLLAARVAGATVPGDLLILTGPLGAGKTTFVQRLAAALGSDAPVNSPTYTLVHEYPSPGGTLVHVDLYRLGADAPLEALGLEDYLDRARLVAVEWGGPLLELYPAAHHLALDPVPGAKSTRTVTWRRPRQ